jgi:hypothetical protein
VSHHNEQEIETNSSGIPLKSTIPTMHATCMPKIIGQLRIFSFNGLIAKAYGLLLFSSDIPINSYSCDFYFPLDENV